MLPMLPKERVREQSKAENKQKNKSTLNTPKTPVEKLKLLLIE